MTSGVVYNEHPEKRAKSRGKRNGLKGPIVAFYILKIFIFQSYLEGDFGPIDGAIVGV